MMEAARTEPDQTIDPLETATKKELYAVKAAATVVMNTEPAERPYRRLSEEEFFAHVDQGLAELDAGLGEGSDLVDAEIAAAFGLAM